MVNFNQHTGRTVKKADQLLDEFITELDQMSSNGVVKHPDMARISDLREHFIGQCAGRQQSWLAEQIDLILSSKMHYFDNERNMSITELTETKIIEKIKTYVLSLKDRAPKYIGMILSMRWINPVHWAKSFLQPAVANSILTFSVVLNPPAVENNHHSNLSDQTGLTPITRNVNQPSDRSYVDLLNIKPYVEQPENISQPVIRKTIKSNPLVKQTGRSIELNTSSEENHRIILSNSENQLSKLPLEEPIAVPNTKISNSFEIRTQSEIQNVFYLNDQRLKNCLSINSRQLVRPKIKISVKFDISPSGKPKNIHIIDNALGNSVAERLVLQIYQFRFSQVDQKRGDQSVFHTLFFK